MGKVHFSEGCDKIQYDSDTHIKVCGLALVHKLFVSRSEI